MRLESLGGAGKSDRPDIRDAEESVRKLLRVGLEDECRPEFGDRGRRVSGGSRSCSWAYIISPDIDDRGSFSVVGGVEADSTTPTRYTSAIVQVS